ncbi:MAG: adenylate/guanylate cyclase domain-containing protein [Chitinophagaceae bacterium]
MRINLYTSLLLRLLTMWGIFLWNDAQSQTGDTIATINFPLPCKDLSLYDFASERMHTTAKSFDEVTVLFIKGFTNVAEKMTAQELVKEINTYFSAFDVIIQKYGLEKIKTIGDAYIAAGGLPEKNSATAQNVIEAAIAMQQAVEIIKQERVASGKPYFELRIGIHTGPVVAGVVGIKKFQYDILGDRVNRAARREQSGVSGKINISQHTYEGVKDQFTCSHRGKIETKIKGEINM